MASRHEPAQLATLGGNLHENPPNTGVAVHQHGSTVQMTMLSATNSWMNHKGAYPHYCLRPGVAYSAFGNRKWAISTYIILRTPPSCMKAPALLHDEKKVHCNSPQAHILIAHRTPATSLQCPYRL
eukprot:1161782-Pelagomonas_calceolata.AAC.6